jgi:hypothetical protein
MNRRYGSIDGASAVLTRNDRYSRRVGPLKARCHLFFLVLWAQLVSGTEASEYRLVKGKQYPLCQALQKNFDAFRPNPPLMSCGLRFKPEAKLLRSVPWRAVDLADYEVAIRQAYEQIFRPRVPPEKLVQRVDSEFVRLMDNARAGKARLWRADFDFVNEWTDGVRTHQIESVLRLMESPCDDSVPPQKWQQRWSMPKLLAVAPTQTEHGKLFEMVEGYEILPTAAFDTFLYDGKARLIQWDPVTLDRKVGRNAGVGAEVRIYDPVSSGGIFWRVVCEFDFRE